MDWNIWLIGVLVLAFAFHAIRHGALQWLWFSVAIWLALGLFSVQFLPRVLGIIHTANLYLAHFYVFVGSIFFWLNSVRKLPDEHRQTPLYQGQTGAFLTLLALASLVMHLAFVLCVFLVWWWHPNALTPFLSPALLELYGTPWLWWTFTAFIMDIFWLHRSWLNKQDAACFSATQLHIGFWLAFILQAMFVAVAVSRTLNG